MWTTTQWKVFRKSNIQISITVLLISKREFWSRSSLGFPKLPERSREERVHLLKRLALGLRQAEGEEDDGHEAADGVEVPGSELEGLEEVEEGLRHGEVEGPVEAGGDTDSLTPEPERVYLERKQSYENNSWENIYSRFLKYNEWWKQELFPGRDYPC